MIWKRRKFWLVLVAAATLLGLFEAAQLYTGAGAGGSAMSWRHALAAAMPSWYVLAVLLPGILAVARRFPLEPGCWRAALAAHVCAAVLFAVLHTALSGLLSDHLVNRGLDPAGTVGTNLARLRTVHLYVELFTYFALVGAYHAYDYAQRLRQQERAAAALALKATRLEASLARANLDSLRMQLDPHFLFNTLNAVSVLAMKGEAQSVVRMLALVSDVLRITLDNTQPLVPLRQELEFLDRYLQIEQIRFEDRLRIELEIEPDTLTAEVPSLLLQPLVENAVGHGISRRPGPGAIRIEARIVGGEVLELRVLDTGPGFSGGPASRTAVARSGGTGVGLTNARARLEQLYGERHELRLENRPVGGACVTVRLPLRLFSSVPEAQPRATAAV
jgi:two-component system, LytTR family, sensor kinase